MADIDKTLPNVIKQPTEVPTLDLEDTEVNLVQDQVTTDVEQTELPDGGVEVNFNPNTKMNGQGVQGPLENLAESLSESALSLIGSEMHQNYTDYKTSRKDWEQTYVKGLDLLGFQYTVKT